MMHLLVVAASLTALAPVVCCLLLVQHNRAERIRWRLRIVSGGVPSEPASSQQWLIAFVTTLGTAVARSGLLSTGTLAQLEQTLQAAGLRGGNGLGLFVGCKLLLLAGLPLVAWFGLGSLDLALLWHEVGTVGAAVVGLLLPDMIVRSRRAAVLRALNDGMPDALDMMVICSEAGLGLEPAVGKVAAEIGHAHPAVAAELSLLANELRIMSDRRAALLALGTRTGLDSLKRLAATLVQTMQYGTPLSQALRVLSAEMRGEMLVRFEARAARLPVLLTLPMIIFILPTVFVVVGGPAMLSVVSRLTH